MAAAAVTARRVLTVYSKPACSLCDDALEAIASTLASLPAPAAAAVTVATVDISEPAHAPWQQRYQYDIPVVHLDGVPIMKHRVDPRRLAQLLLLAPPPPSTTPAPR
jgi:glutaredoxin